MSQKQVHVLLSLVLSNASHELLLSEYSEKGSRTFQSLERPKYTASKLVVTYSDAERNPRARAIRELELLMLFALPIYGKALA